jgi:hypothetical protein
MVLINKDKSPSLSQQDEFSDGEEGMKDMMGEKLLIVITIVDAAKVQKSTIISNHNLATTLEGLVFFVSYNDA